MSVKKIKILLVEDDDDYSNLLQLILNRENHRLFEVSVARQLSNALFDLAQNHYDLILLDLWLPDSQGFNSFLEIHGQAPDTPVVVLTALRDEKLAIRAVKEGAQDYIFKGSIEGSLLVQSIRYAIERQQVLTRLQYLTLVDELTGLLNRRGFLSIANQQLKIARRANRELVLFFVDMDELKKINDSFGHKMGDQALRTIASILKKSFRSSDVIGRLGGDEFTVLAIDTAGDTDHIILRLQESIEQHNLADPLLPLSLSMGVARYDPKNGKTLEELLDEADRALYLQKRGKRG